MAQCTAGAIDPVRITSFLLVAFILTLKSSLSYHFFLSPKSISIIYFQRSKSIIRSGRLVDNRSQILKYPYPYPSLGITISCYSSGQTLILTIK